MTLSKRGRHVITNSSPAFSQEVRSVAVDDSNDLSKEDDSFQFIRQREVKEENKQG